MLLSGWTEYRPCDFRPTIQAWLNAALFIFDEIPLNIAFPRFFEYNDGRCFIAKKGGSATRILIDGDGCPVVDETIRLAKQFQREVIILCDTSHVFEKPGVKTMTVSRGADSVDFALVNLIQKGDLAITQDYGLAAMCLARGAFVMNQDGMEYTSENIDALLLARHTAKKIRNGGGRLKGASKRTAAQNQAYGEALTAFLRRTQQEEF